MFFTPARKVSTKHLIEQHITVLKGLQYKSGLFAASNKDAPTGYGKSWLRDNFYECLGFQAIDDWETIEHTMAAVLRIFEKHEEKINHAIQHKPQARHEYIHARFHPETFDEFWEEWGNKQNDSVGAILYLVGELDRRDHGFLHEKKHRRLVEKLVAYLESIQYWHDADSGMWEENEEVHASSVGACVAGLKSVKRAGIHVPPGLIEKGEHTLAVLLPRESSSKFVDLALLSLIWPYNVVTPKQRDEILKNVEYHLLRDHGVIRYKNDYYYNKNPDGYSEEAEWCFGISWLLLIYEELGNEEKKRFYLEKMLGTVTPKGQVPELYFSHSDKWNDNTPLGWSESLFVLALYHLGEKYITLHTPKEKTEKAEKPSGAAPIKKVVANVKAAVKKIRK
jgi:phosphorylase kinase alpha/beta subunit